MHCINSQWKPDASESLLKEERSTATNLPDWFVSLGVYTAGFLPPIFTYTFTEFIEEVSVHSRVSSFSPTLLFWSKKRGPC